MQAPLLTTLVGSYPQPEWLVDRELLGRVPPARVPSPELWRLPKALLELGQDDATLLALRDMEWAGIDVVTDGEVRRRATRRLWLGPDCGMKYLQREVAFGKLQSLVAGRDLVRRELAR